jgi:hypothetical protein
VVSSIFSVYDSKAEFYLFPMVFKSKGEAIRSFTAAASDKETNIGKYPEDFVLFEVGTFDDSNCKYILLDTPSPIGKAIEFVKTE